MALYCEKWPKKKSNIHKSFLTINEYILCDSNLVLIAWYYRSRDDDAEEDTAKKARTAAAAATASASEQEQAGEFIPLRLDTPVQDPAVQDEGNFYENY